MKIAVTSQASNLDSPMDQRFGRCPYVLVVETDDLSFEVVKNPYFDESGGVGSRLASLIARHGARVVIAEECGPHAQDSLHAAGISLVALCADTVRQAVEQYQADSRHPTSVTPDEPTVTPSTPTQREKNGRGRMGQGHAGGSHKRPRWREC